MNEKYEYKLLSYSTYDIFEYSNYTLKISQELTKLGQDGWELFNITAANYGVNHNSLVLYHFRRDLKTCKYK